MGRLIALLLLGSLTLSGREWVLHIEGMHCIACTLAVKKALMSVSGVQEAKVNFKTETARVSTLENVSFRSMQEAVAATGYQIEPLAKTDR